MSQSLVISCRDQICFWDFWNDIRPFSERRNFYRAVPNVTEIPFPGTWYSLLPVDTSTVALGSYHTHRKNEIALFDVVTRSPLSTRLTVPAKGDLSSHIWSMCRVPLSGASSLTASMLGQQSTSPFLVATAQADNRVQVWDLLRLVDVARRGFDDDSKKPLSSRLHVASFDCFRDMVWDVSLYPSRRSLIAASWDNCVRLLDLESGKVAATASQLFGKSSDIYTAALDEPHARIFAGGRDSSTGLIALDPRDSLRPVLFFGNQYSSSTFKMRCTPTRLYVTGSNGLFRCFDLRKVGVEPLYAYDNFHAPKREFFGLDPCIDFGHVATCGLDKLVCLANSKGRKMAQCRLRQGAYNVAYLGNNGDLPVGATDTLAQDEGERLGFLQHLYERAVLGQLWKVETVAGDDMWMPVWVVKKKKKHPSRSE